ATCLPQTMLLCNPSEPVGGGTGNASSFNPTRGQMFVFSTTGNTGGFSPGFLVFLIRRAAAVRTRISRDSYPSKQRALAARKAQAQHRGRKQMLQLTGSMFALIRPRVAKPADTTSHRPQSKSTD